MYVWNFALVNLLANVDLPQGGKPNGLLGPEVSALVARGVILSGMQQTEVQACLHVNHAADHHHTIFPIMLM
jgi:hypothetical protein